MRFPRSSGILLPVFSLPGRFGIGDVGPQAVEFLKFLKQAGQSIWQVLPLAPTTRGHSPYSSYSAFAGNRLLISPEMLESDGLVSGDDVRAAEATNGTSHRVNYEHAEQTRQSLLETAWRRFRDDSSSALQVDFESYLKTNAPWLDDFALFEAIAEKTGTQNWSLWDDVLRRRDPSALKRARSELKDRILFSQFVQFMFARQWNALKERAAAEGIRLYGDMPIFVAYESADVWVHQDLFCLNEDGLPTFVAGVPPDYFSSTGQKWGNPVYRWERVAETGYRWWIDRIRHALTFFDILRIDHFRGFESYWAVPADAPDARTGEWRQGPRDEFFAAVSAELGELPIVAEDLGLITDEVHHLRDRLGFPGMRVLQFGFEHEHDAYHRPDCYPEHCVAYTGTHDNNTTMGWFHEKFPDGPSELIARFLSGDPDRIHLDLIAAVMNSAADTAVIPMQDVLGLPASERMNTPGVPDGNWRWRCDAAYLNEGVAAEMMQLSSASGRVSSM